MTVRGVDRIGWPNPEDEEPVLRDVLVPFARARIETQIEDMNALDLKALGALALAAAAIGVLIFVHDDVHALWPLAMGGFALSAIFLFVGLWPRHYEPGIDLKDFYTRMSGRVSLVAYRQMFAELIACEERNHGPVSEKVLICRWGFGFLIVSLLGMIPIAVFRP